MLLLEDWVVQQTGSCYCYMIRWFRDRVVLLLQNWMVQQTGSCYCVTANMVVLLCYRTGWYGRQGCVTGLGNATDLFKAHVTGLGNAAYRLCYRTW